ncbi:MAG: tetratricopeptide (TPR) repeat protein [Rhodothermales bacterium]|jgi:tetratricopeptide (TPR) repeat protein
MRLRLLLLICLLGPLGKNEVRAQAPQDPVLTASRLLVRGMTRSFLGDHQGAAELLDQALRFQPEDAAIHAALASAYAELGDASQATFYAERALQLAPDRPENLEMVAELREATGDGVGSLEAYDQLVALKPLRVEAHVARARLLSRLEQRVSAAGAYATALSIAPLNPETLREYRDVTVSLGELDTALKTATSLTGLDPTAEDEQIRAEILVRLGRTSDAVAAFQRVLVLSPGDGEATAALASLAPDLVAAPDADAGDPVARAHRTAAAADDDVRNLAVRIEAIWANLEIGRMDVASPLVEDGLLFFPGDQDLTLAAFETYLHALQLDEAAAILEQGEALSVDAEWQNKLRAARALLEWLLTGDTAEFDTVPTGRASAWAEVASTNNSASLLGQGVPGASRSALQWLILGDIQARAGNRTRAARAWQEALAAAPNSDLVLARLQ